MNPSTSSVVQANASILAIAAIPAMYAAASTDLDARADGVMRITRNLLIPAGVVWLISNSLASSTRQVYSLGFIVVSALVWELFHRAIMRNRASHADDIPPWQVAVVQASAVAVSILVAWLVQTKLGYGVFNPQMVVVQNA